MMAVHKGRPSLKRRLEERKTGMTPEMDFPRPVRRYKCKCSDQWKQVIFVDGGNTPESWNHHENICPIFRAQSLTANVNW